MFVTADGKVQARTLNVQRSIGNSWLVNQGLQDGDRIIVEGGQRVKDGQEVNVSMVTIDDATGDIKQASADVKKSTDQASIANPEKGAATGTAE
jgi:membrane fusion protein (multidrug efflux system)